MPSIYLSPSTQEFNPYAGGGNEEYYMNLIADAMIPYLDATGISYTRNTPQMTAASSISASNSGNYDLHLGLHSNAAPASNAGKIRGSEVYYYPSSTKGKRAADIIANNLKLIYPLPERVRTIPTTSIGEVSKVRAPAAFIEFAYHDNIEDADWIRNNIDKIAENIVVSLADYFGIPFMMPGGNQNVPENSKNYAVVNTSGKNLNLRSAPNYNSEVIGSLPNGATVTVTSALGEWKGVTYMGKSGFANAKYLK
ncbi:MAG: N-acetylmuramoyl-L-alanine amidase, partial [Clostridiales bacterium]|nr:N-acetylmuramoyl-L-alanine amidase [Candidatus Equinaster intestinalis]